MKNWLRAPQPFWSNLSIPIPRWRYHECLIFNRFHNYFFNFHCYFILNYLDQIPVDSFTKVALKKRVESGDLQYDMYDHVQKIVCEFMRGDSYPRFLKADLYEAIMTTRFKKRGNVGDKKSKVKTATKPESVSENPSPSNTSCGCFGP